MKVPSLMLLCLLVVGPASGQPASADFELQWARGLCVECRMPFELARVQFLSDAEAWATAFASHVSGGHVSEYATLVHTADGGRTWRRLKGVETYGVAVRPAFWFLDAHRGWVAWPTAWDAKDHMLRTIDGSTWKPLPGNDSVVHLQFFDGGLGRAASSTPDGARFARTRDGGANWTSQETALVYPDVLAFQTPMLGWLGGLSKRDGALVPRLLRTDDGGERWVDASLPEALQGDPHDLFFRDALHGWLILWNTADGGSALLQTIDGGRTWKSVPESSFRGRNKLLSAVRFVSEQVGYAFMRSSDGDSPATAPGTVFSTRDGGRSWRPFPLPRSVQACDVRSGEVWCTSGMDILKLRPKPFPPS